MKVNLGRYPKDADKPRKIEVKIDPWDTWSMDNTLAYIIHPMLVQLKETKHGSPWVDIEDVPHIGKGEDDGSGSDTLLHERWDWVLDEMIWAFKTINEEWEKEFYTPPKGEWSWENCGTVDAEGLQKVRIRLENGFRLFGKYYQGLWD